MPDQPPPAPAPSADKSDAESNKALAIVGYIIPILFFLPLVIESSKNSPFAKFHANQQLILLIVGFALQIAGGLIPVIGWHVILPVGWVFVFVCVIMGVINAVNGQMKQLPLIGGFTILK
ncbi:MAG TPA: DUF4870 domain-containing protein [Verrucomicrobiae bacterium]|nr:DUF4870 domain-containing protein [Verrucomicrobiae bacterium]